MTNDQYSDPYWYRNPVLLKAARDEYGSLEEAARQIGGCSAAVLQKWWRRNGLAKLQHGLPPRGTINQEAMQRIYQRVYG